MEKGELAMSEVRSIQNCGRQNLCPYIIHDFGWHQRTIHAAQLTTHDYSRLVVTRRPSDEMIPDAGLMPGGHEFFQASSHRERRVSMFATIAELKI